MSPANEEVARRLMKREQFPTFLIGYNGDPFMNHAMIPPLHGSIVEKGFSAGDVIAVMEESLEKSYDDVMEIRKKKINSSIDPGDVENFIRVWKSSYEAGEDCITFKGFPHWNTLVIQKERISPYGGDHYLIIDGKDGIHATYHVPRGHQFGHELSDEYGLSHEHSGKSYEEFYCENTGWRTHNAGAPLSIFYKNIVIGMNNAAVMKKYGK